MSNTKSKLLSVLEEFEITGEPLPITGVYVIHEDRFPVSDWVCVLDDGDVMLHADYETKTVVLSYDNSSMVGFHREYLVLGDTSAFEGVECLDSEEHSLWYQYECDIYQIYYLCPHIVETMDFKDDDNRDQKNSVLEIDFDALTEERIAELKSQGLIQEVDLFLDNVRYEINDDHVIDVYGEPESNEKFDVEKLGDNQYKLTFHDLEFLRERDIVMACGEYDDYQRTQEAIVRRGWWFNGF
ncbi:TPA: hypothetical protein ACX6PX_001451 [Photobacterium damselae]